MEAGGGSGGEEEEVGGGDAEPNLLLLHPPPAHRKGREVGWGSRAIMAVRKRSDGRDLAARTRGLAPFPVRLGGFKRCYSHLLIF